MSKEAITLALEALQRIDLWLKARYQVGLVGIELEAIKALEEALSKQEPTERNFCERCGKRLSDGIHTCTPPAKQEHTGEPDEEVLGFNGWGFPIEHPPKAEKQDDGYCQACDGQYCTAKKGCVALDNPQPKREPLTDEQIQHIRNSIDPDICFGLGLLAFTRAIEAAHGIKEGGAV